MPANLSRSVNDLFDLIKLNVIVRRFGGTMSRQYFPFMPRSPAGYAWTYGYTSQAALESDAYQGNASGGLYWFCLYPISAGGAEGIYRGVKRAQQFFPQSQFYTGPNGAVSCGHPLNSSVPVTYPATISVTFFVRYVAETP